MVEAITINKALNLLEKYYVPDIIKKHSINVTKVATFISQKYVEKGLIDKKSQLKIIIAAILHDLTKVTEIKDFERLFDKDSENYVKAISFWTDFIKKYNKIDHENSACEEIKSYSNVVAEMIKNTKYANKLKDKSLDMNILTYSDLRDEMGEIVHLSQRLILSNKRYAHKNKTIEHWEKVMDFNIKQLEREKELFSKINVLPDECNKLNKIELLRLFNKYNININEGL
jgi:hypothetical protein